MCVLVCVMAPGKRDQTISSYFTLSFGVIPYQWTLRGRDSWPRRRMAECEVYPTEPLCTYKLLWIRVMRVLNDWIISVWPTSNEANKHYEANKQ
jgi:hypothetical protein